MALIRGGNVRKFYWILTIRRRTLKNLYIILLLTFGFGQDYSLSFDGVDDYVSLPEGILSSSDARTIMIFVNPKSEGMIYSSFYNSTGEYRIEPHQFALKGSDSQWYYAGIPNEQVDYVVPVLITGVWDKQNIYFSDESFFRCSLQSY